MTQLERGALWFAVGCSVVNLLTVVAWWLVVVAAVAVVTIGLCWAWEEWS